MSITPRTALILRIVIISVIYFLLNNPVGYTQWKLFQIALYPIRIFVVFLHEFGHAAGAILTGGKVHSIEILTNAGGFARSSGGYRPVIIMGGYVGSALFGNILFYIGAKKPNWVKPTLCVIIFIMLVTGFLWYKTVFTTAILCGFSLILFWVGFKTKLGREVLMFFGLASILYIIQDFRVGPSGDLANFEKEMKFLPAQVWMYIWLGIVLALLALNLKLLFSVREVETPPVKRNRVNTKKGFNPLKKK